LKWWCCEEEGRSVVWLYSGEGVDCVRVLKASGFPRGVEL